MKLTFSGKRKEGFTNDELAMLHCKMGTLAKEIEMLEHRGTTYPWLYQNSRL